MIQPMSVAKWTTSPSFTSVWYATSRAIETRKPPWTCSTPFGWPVVPDVYVRRYGCSESTCSAGRRSRLPPHELGPLGALPVPLDHRNVAAAPRRPSRASAASGRAGTSRQRRSRPSRRRPRAAVRSRALRTPRRSAPAPPRRARTHARPRRPRGTSACRSRRGRRARRRARRAPRRAASSRETARRTCARAASPSSPRKTAATSSGRRSAWRWTQFVAMFSRPPTNHVAHSIPADSSSTRSHGVENSSPRSSINAGQNRSGSSTERRCSSW